MSNCQIIGPCSEILVVCVFFLCAFMFASCLLPPLCWNNLIWSDPSFLPKKQGGNLSWKHCFCWWDSWKVFGDISLSTVIKGNVEWFVAPEILLGCLWVEWAAFAFSKHAGNAQNIGWAEPKISRNKKWGCLAEKRKFLSYYYSYCKWKYFLWPADGTQHN